MVIIELSGGLGNQMFQYSLYRAFIHKNVISTMDPSLYRDVLGQASIELNRFPNVKYGIADAREVSKLRGYGYNDSIIDKAINRLNKRYRNF